MYQNFYGLNQLPFNEQVDGQCFFGGGQRQEVLDALLYFSGRGEKMVVVTGDVGVGKTTLIQSLQLRLPERVSRVLLTGPYLMQQELQEALLAYLSIKVEFGEDKFEALLNRLQQLVEQSSPLLVIVDDAHKLSQASLDFLISLTGLGSVPNPPLIQLILFGLPELSKLIPVSQEMGFSDPASFRARLNAFSIDELQAYLDYRMSYAGHQGDSMFNESVVRAIFAVTKGMPKAINRMLDHLLMSCYAKGHRQISIDDVNAIAHIQQRVQVRESATHRFFSALGSLMLKPPVVISVVTAFVVGLSLLAGYFISDYLMINQTKADAGKSSIVNSMSIDAPIIEPEKHQPEDALITSSVTPALASLAQPAPVTPLKPDTEPSTKTAPVKSATTEPNAFKATPPGKVLASESITNNDMRKVQTITSSASIAGKSSAPTPETVKDTTKDIAKKQTPPVTPESVKKEELVPKRAEAIKKTQSEEVVAKTTIVAAESRSWPIAGNWAAHHKQTLSHLKSLQDKGATYTIQLMSDPWRTRDAFIAAAQSRLQPLVKQQPSFLVDYNLEDGRPRVALIYGAYHGSEEAHAALRAFPEEVAKFKPVVKSLGLISDQMQRSSVLNRDF